MPRAKSQALTGRNGAIWQGTLRGIKQDMLAAQYGISQSRVSQILAEVRAQIPEPVIEDIRRMEADRIERLYAETVRIMEADHPLVSVQRGTVIVDPDTGQRLQDDGPKLAAINTALRIHDRVAKAYGLDAPARTVSELDVTVGEVTEADLAFRQMVGEQRDRRAAARDAAA